VKAHTFSVQANIAPPIMSRELDQVDARDPVPVELSASSAGMHRAFHRVSFHSEKSRSSSAASGTRMVRILPALGFHQDASAELDRNWDVPDLNSLVRGTFLVST